MLPPQLPKLTGGQRRRLQTVVLKAFDLADLQQLVRHQLDENLESIVNVNESEQKIVFDLFNWAEKHNRMAELLNAIQDERPKRADIKQITTEFLSLEPKDEIATSEPRLGRGATSSLLSRVFPKLSTRSTVCASVLLLLLCLPLFFSPFTSHSRSFLVQVIPGPGEDLPSGIEASLSIGSYNQPRRKLTSGSILFSNIPASDWMRQRNVKLYSDGLSLQGPFTAAKGEKSIDILLANTELPKGKSTRTIEEVVKLMQDGTDNVLLEQQLLRKEVKWTWVWEDGGKVANNMVLVTAALPYTRNDVEYEVSVFARFHPDVDPPLFDNQNPKPFTIVGTIVQIKHNLVNLKRCREIKQ